MKFDRLLCTSQLSGDLLIQKSGHNQSHYLALARREGIEPTLQVPQLGLLCSSYAVTLEALPYRIDEILIAIWFCPYDGGLPLISSIR